MMGAKTATVRVTGVEATYTTADHRWHCDDKRVEDLLNRLLAHYERPGWVANGPLDIARHAMAVMGGEVIAADPVDDDELRSLPATLPDPDTDEALIAALRATHETYDPDEARAILARLPRLRDDAGTASTVIPKRRKGSEGR